MSTVVHMLIGNALYAEAAGVALEAVLSDSTFDVVATRATGAAFSLPRHGRIRYIEVPAVPSDAHRAERFLQKFHALRACLGTTSHDYLLQLDADVVLARPLKEKQIVAALHGAGLGMVEQTTVTGSGMDRAAFLDHYQRHALALIAPDTPPPALTAFRYYNSGVVVGTRQAWEALVGWAITRIAEQTGPHQVGEHMVADQDYFQYWAVTLHPERCVELPWYWNHCEYWDAPFPKRGVLFAHFSNFCNGPAADTVRRMRAFRRPVTRWKNRCTLLS